MGDKTQAGKTQVGYVVSGYKIKLDGEVAKTGAGESGKYTLNATNFETIVKGENRFKTATITISTQRTPATYKLYLDRTYAGATASKAYFTYAWNESKDTGNWGQVNANQQITINVTYGSAPANIQNAINAGALTVTRNGYSLSGWFVSDKSGNQVEKLDVAQTFTRNDDVYIVPQWTINTTKATEIESAYQPSKNELYLYPGHSADLFIGSLTKNVASNIAPTKDMLLKNAEKVSSFKYVISGANSGERTSAKLKRN